MAQVNIHFLEQEIAEINKWLDVQDNSHPLTQQKKQQRDHYVWKLCQIDEHNLQTIEI